MARYILSTHSDAAVPIRRQVSFMRNDLLLDGEVIHPETGEIINLPIQGDNGLIGPAILHCLVRKVVKTASLPEHHRKAAAAANGGIEPEYCALWTLLDTEALWRTGDLPPPREPSGAADDRGPEHPFKPELVTGGSQHGQMETGWIPIRKSSTVWTSDGAFRLAAAMHGGADAAAKRIGELASAAWDADLERCQDFYDAIADSGPDGLLEDESVLALRPHSSISQEVEKAVLDEALRWLGVDPSEKLTRTPGRRAAPGDEGDIITVDIDADGHVHGHLRTSFSGWPAATKLTDIPSPRLVELLGRLRTEHRGTDADLLEAYLDAAHPTWRDVAMDEPADATTAFNPWEVLGVSKGASRDEVVAAYRSIMMKVHPDTGGLPAWVSRAVADAYRALKEAA